MEHNFTSFEYSGYLFTQGIFWPNFRAFWHPENGLMALQRGSTFDQTPDGTQMVPAYTATELRWAIGGQFQQNPRLKAPVMNYERKLTHQFIWEVYYPNQMAVYKSEADAAAAWLIFLISKGQVTVPEVNERLARLAKT